MRKSKNLNAGIVLIEMVIVGIFAAIWFWIFGDIHPSWREILGVWWASCCISSAFAVAGHILTIAND